MSKIVLDADAFKALASDTRLEILKALDVRRLTVSELGRVLNLNKATVFEHLKQLMAADLVKKDDEGRKWVYYRLTWKGRNILHPENAQIFLLLSMAALGMGGAVTALGRAMDWWLVSAPAAGEGGAQAPSGPDQEAMTQRSAADDSTGTEPVGAEPAADSDSGGLWTSMDFWFFVVLLVVAALLTALAVRFWLRRRRDRQDFARRIQAADLSTS